MVTVIRQDYAIKVSEYVYVVAESSGQPPFHIPQFWFVELTLVLDLEHLQSLDSRKQKKAVFLVEEVIAEDRQGPFRKYLNNVSPNPLQMTTKKDNDRVRFLAYPSVESMPLPHPFRKVITS